MVILVQGAMEEEVNVLSDYFSPYSKVVVHGYDFFICEYKGHKVIISQTKSGIINATIATVLAIKEFSPDIVINQGCAGGHTQELHQGDIVIGEKMVYMNDFKTPTKEKGAGSSSLDWYPNPKRSYESFSSKALIEIAKKVNNSTKVNVGVLGSGDMHSKEVDRIEYLRSIFHQDCEDMESIAAMKVCDTFNVEKIALRVISNNELINESFNKIFCKNMQEFVIRMINLLI